MENYMMIDGKKIEISEDTAKNFKEQFGGDNGVWLPEVDERYYCFDSNDGDDNWGVPPSKSRIEEYLVQNIYKTEEARDANVELQEYINEMTRKYGWIKMNDGDCYHMSYSGGFTWMDLWTGESYSQYIQKQRSGLVMHKDSMREERRKMERLIKEANKYITK